MQIDRAAPFNTARGSVDVRERGREREGEDNLGIDERASAAAPMESLFGVPHLLNSVFFFFLTCGEGEIFLCR